ncbi:MAG: hypothetical protein LH702_21890 [Phormidesmis sp. CAN_BIN44]|nr:hypothetical protein [Phormidesmis sp. CAN_BIN44]
MRELKSESQSIQSNQVELDGHPSRSSKSKKHAVDLDRAESALADAAPEAPVQEVTPTRKRRAATAKTKPQTTVQAKPIASTQVKLTWEPTQPSIVARFQRLEQELRQLKTQADQINQQSIGIQSEMQELRTIAHAAHPLRPAEAMMKQPVPSPALDIPPFLLDRRPSQPEAVVESLSEETKISSAHCQNTPSVAQPSPSDIPRFSTSPRPRVAVVPRRRTLRYYWRRLQPRLQLSQTRGAIAIDAVIWTFAAAGLHIGLKFLAEHLPFLGLPISLLLFAPAVLAGYLAFCVPKSSPVFIYRLLLIALGLLLGGKL